MAIFPFYFASFSTLTFIIIASVFLTLFILGNILILLGIRHQSKIMIITGIILTGGVWGIFLWLKKTRLIKASKSEKTEQKSISLSQD